MGFGKHENFFEAKAEYIAQRDACEELWQEYKNTPADQFENWWETFDIISNMIDEVNELYYDLKKLMESKNIRRNNLPSMWIA